MVAALASLHEWMIHGSCINSGISSSKPYVYANSKVQGLLDCEQLALHHHLCHPHHTLTQIVYRYKAGEEKAPAP